MGTTTNSTRRSRVSPGEDESLNAPSSSILESEPSVYTQGGNDAGQSPLERLQRRLEACNFALGIALIASASHLNLFSIRLILSRVSFHLHASQHQSVLPGLLPFLFRTSKPEGMPVTKQLDDRSTESSATIAKPKKQVSGIRARREKVAHWALRNSTLRDLWNALLLEILVSAAIVMLVYYAYSLAECPRMHFLTYEIIAEQNGEEFNANQVVHPDNMPPDPPSPSLPPPHAPPYPPTWDAPREPPEPPSWPDEDRRRYQFECSNPPWGFHRHEADDLMVAIQYMTLALGTLALVSTCVTVVSLAVAVMVIRATRAFAPRALSIYVTDLDGGGQSAPPQPLQAAVETLALRLSSEPSESGRAATERDTKAVESAAAELNRFRISKLMYGRPIDSALGLMQYMCVDEHAVYARLACGVAAIREEFERHGSADDLVCLEYVLEGRTGELTREWANGVVDSSRPKGLRLDDFVQHASSRLAGLSAAHVAALRLYTCHCFWSLNTPLRRRAVAHKEATAYPFPVTLMFISDAIRRLRAVGASQDGANAPRSLWRGMRNLCVDVRFKELGATELAPMSTTSRLDVAVAYSLGHMRANAGRALLLKLHTESFMDRGADLSFLSAFPGEAEICFPPLTHARAARTSAPSILAS